MRLLSYIGALAIAGGLLTGVPSVAGSETRAAASVPSLAFSEPGFPSLTTDDSAARDTFVINQSANTVVISANQPTLSGDDSNAFELLSDSCTGQSLAADDSCVITIRFAPLKDGTSTADLTVVSDAPDGPHVLQLSASTIPAAPTTPSKPLNVRAAAGDENVQVSWDPPSSAGSFPITTYQVQGAPTGSCIVSAPATSCLIAGLTNDTGYTFSVRALNGAGWGPSSDATSPATPQKLVIPPDCPVTSDYVVNLLYVMRTDGFMNYGDGTNVLGPVPKVGIQTLNLPGNTAFDLKVIVSLDDSQTEVIATNKQRIGGSSQSIDRREFSEFFVMNYGVRYYLSYRLLALDGPDGDQLYGSLDGTTLACSPVVYFSYELSDAPQTVKDNYVRQAYPADTDYNGTKGVGAGGVYGCAIGGLADCPMILGSNPYASSGLFGQTPQAPDVDQISSPSDDSITLEISLANLGQASEIQYSTDDSQTWATAKFVATSLDDSSLAEATPRTSISAATGGLVLTTSSSGASFSPSSVYKVRIRTANSPPSNDLGLSTRIGAATSVLCAQPGAGQVTCPTENPPPSGGGGGGAPPGGGGPVVPPEPPAPGPEPSEPPRPFPSPVTDSLEPGAGQLFVNGHPTDLTVERDQESGTISLRGTDFALEIQSEDSTGGPGAIGGDSGVVLTPDSPLAMTAVGYAPQSELSVYLISGEGPEQKVGSSAVEDVARLLEATDDTAARELMSVTTDDSGQAVASVLVPHGTQPGDYVLQIVGATIENAVRTVNLGITVRQIAVEPKISISGSRGSVSGKRGIIVTGTTIGLAGKTVFPRIKLKGQASYSDGVARRPIRDDGTFRWQRRGGKKISVYFQVVDESIRSNRLVLR